MWKFTNKYVPNNTHGKISKFPVTRNITNIGTSSFTIFFVHCILPKQSSKNHNEYNYCNHKPWNQTMHMVNSIVNEIIIIPRWFNCPSWHCGDNLITLEGLLHNLTKGLGTFERVISFHWIVNRLHSLSTNVYINVITNMLTGCMFEELRIASQSGTRVHMD